MSLTQSASKSGKLSIRNSVFIWVAGAVFGWVLMVVSVYNVLRNSEDQDNISGASIIAEQQQKTLNEIAPASGTMTKQDEAEDPIDEKVDDPS